MKLKIAQARRVPCSHTAANTLLGRACQPPISDWQCEFREEVNICTVSCSQMLLAMPKAASHVLSRHLLRLLLQTCMPKYVQNNKSAHTHAHTYSVQRKCHHSCCIILPTFSFSFDDYTSLNMWILTADINHAYQGLLN